MLQEPTSYEEIEVENYATFPSITLCPRNSEYDNFSTFDDIMQEIEELNENTHAGLWVEGLKQYLDLKNTMQLTMELNTSMDYVWEYSAVLQHQFKNAIIPCITINFPAHKMSNKGTLNLLVSVKNYSPSTNIYFTKHEYRQLRHNYQIDQSLSYQLLMKNEGHTEYFIQVETTHLKKSRFECFEDNSMYFKDCIEEFIAEQVGCHLPWTKQSQINRKVCQDQQELKDFRNLSFYMMSQSPEIKDLITKKGCFKPNCRQTTWTKNQFIERWKRENETFLLMIIPPGAKVLQRREVLLADVSTFVADIGSYLGLFLGASILTLTDLVIAFIRRMRSSCQFSRITSNDAKLNV